eukprot:scaffold56903_cov61-Phaeocystis_antarctica.AAC.3
MLGPSQSSLCPTRRFGQQYRRAVLRRGEPRLPAVRHLPDCVHRRARGERRVQVGGRLRCRLPLLQRGPGVVLPACGEEGGDELGRPAGAEADPRRHPAVRDPVEHGLLRQHLRRGLGQSDCEGLLRRDRLQRGQMRGAADRVHRRADIYAGQGLVLSQALLAAAAERRPGHLLVRRGPGHRAPGVQEARRREVIWRHDSHGWRGRWKDMRGRAKASGPELLEQRRCCVTHYVARAATPVVVCYPEAFVWSKG